MDFTDDQQKIIDARNCSLIVSAAAGSGKTAVLVERIIRLITDPGDPVDIDSLLVVTFTNAAAAQMKEKINKALQERIEARPDDANLKRQAALIHNARITTIDSFCQYVLRNSFADIDIDPGFRIAEEGENALLESDVLNDLIETKFGEADEEFIYLADRLATGATDESIYDAVMTVYQKADSDPWPYAWLDERAADYDLEVPGRLPGRIVDMVRDKAVSEVTITIDIYDKAIDLADSAGLHPDYTGVLTAERDTLKGIKDMLEADPKPDYGRMREYMEEVVYVRLPSKKNPDEDKAARDRVKSMRDAAKARITALKTMYLGGSEEYALKHIEDSGRIVRALCKLTARYMDNLRAAKDDKGILSFADCEHYALDILVHRDDDGSYHYTDAAAAYRAHFRYVFIDEYQDSNMIQELIMSAVSGESEGVYNRFMVGDIKQSIYRFRNAEPDIFTARYNEYGYEHKKQRKADLNMNFRSRRQVIDSCNALFERIMTMDTGGADYDTHASLKAGAAYPVSDGDDYTTEIILVNANNTGNSAEAEGEIIARRIQEMVDSQMPIRDESGGLRPVRYGDIVILYRSGIEEAGIYKKALESRLIPTVLTGSTGYFATYEIRSLMNLLRIIVNPLQDIPFYGVMESPIGCFTSEEIAAVSADYIRSLPDGVRTDEGYLYSACKHAALCDDDLVSASLAARIGRFLDMLAIYREHSEYMQVSELICEILSDTGFRSLVLAMRGGSRRAANVDLLVRKAADYSETSYFGLYNFIRYIDTLEQTSAMDAEAETSGDMSEAVRIMTAHKSKGLEFPVVFIARLGSMFNMSDARGTVVCDHNAGIGIKDTDLKTRIRYESLIYRYISDAIHDQTLAEEMRIQYVAMTRAMEKLILVAAIKPEELEDAPGETARYAVKRPNNNTRYIDWYLQCISDETGEDPMILDAFVDYTMIEPLSVKIRLADIPDGDLAEDAIDAAGSILMADQIMNARIDRDGAYYKALDLVYDSIYPHPVLTGLYQKTSVSVLKHAAMPDESDRFRPLYDEHTEAAPVPRFISMTEDLPGATVRGSAFHRLCELLDYSSLHNISSASADSDTLAAYVIEQIDRFVSDGRMSVAQKAMITKSPDLDRIVCFVQNGITKRMAAAMSKNRLYREAPFMIGIAASKVNAGYPDDETVLIQGIIDAYWIEDDGAVILDYKTDRVSDASRLVLLYKTQLDYYAEALEKMRIRVKEKLIYSFELNEVISV